MEIVSQLRVDEKIKTKYMRMASAFEEDIEQNLNKTHFELAKDTGIPYDEWGAFMSITEVAGWLNETTRLTAAVGERKLISDLGRGGNSTKDVNAYKAIKEYNEKNNDVDNSNVVIMYLPPEEE